MFDYLVMSFRKMVCKALRLPKEAVTVACTISPESAVDLRIYALAPTGSWRRVADSEWEAERLKAASAMA